MPYVTTQLGNEPGIQYQGVTDASSKVSPFPVVGLFTGSFRRGRFDKPMVVNLNNIRALLGYDPTNPDYISVLNALEDGAPNVQVLRMGKKSDSSNLCLLAPRSRYASYIFIGEVGQDLSQFKQLIMDSVTLSVEYDIAINVGFHFNFDNFTSDNEPMVALDFELEWQMLDGNLRDYDVTLCANTAFRVELAPM